MTKILESAKAICALVATIATALLAELGPDGTVGATLVALTVIAGAVATYQVPNQDKVEY